MSWLSKQLKFRDLKRAARRVRDEADDDGLIDELEAFAEHKLVETIVEEITEDPLYKSLLKALLNRLKEEL